MGLLDGKTAIEPVLLAVLVRLSLLSLPPKVQTSHLLTLSLTKMQKIQLKNLKQWA